MPKLEGPDVSLEISLKEYGIAWEIGETETRFYYGTSHNGENYTRFDWANLGNDVDVEKEYDWADCLKVANFVGMPLSDWLDLPLVGKIQDLNSYHGFENIFGSSYFEGQTYEEVIANEETPV